MRIRIGWSSFLLGCVAQLGIGCGPEFPSFWFIEPDPLGPDGKVDPAGKLRILAIQADPPEATPDATVRLQALVVTHPQQGQLLPGPNGMQRSTQPQGLTALWLACRQPGEVVSPEPCGLEQLNATTELRRLNPTPPSQPLRFPGEPLRAELQTSSSASGDGSYTLLVTLLVADAALPGGAEACFAQAQANRGVSPSVNHCLIAIKAVRVSKAAAPNHNPGITSLAFGPSGGSLTLQPEGSAAAFTYPRLDAGTSDADRPKLTLAVDRSPDSVEVGAALDGTPRNESLSATFYATGGTLEAGRGSFLDLDCPGQPETCPQFPRTSVDWRPPTARASREAPDDTIHFFVIVRDDRGGLSFTRTTAAAR